jgi:Ca-activated chloride channel family protein
VQQLFPDIHFANYWVLAFIPAVLLLLLWWYVKKSPGQTAAFHVSTTRLFIGSSVRARLRHLLFVFRLLAVSALLIAMARPQKRNDEQLKQGEGIDIILCMDISGSMLSADFKPNRLEVAKEVAAEFIRSRPVDNIGLVIFSGESFTMSPLTTDKNTLLTQVTSLQSGMLRDGTLIGEGLATSVARLDAGKTKSKVVILLTDGKEQPTENRVIDPQTSLEIAKSKNVKVYTIGMALEGYTAVEETTPAGTIAETTTTVLDEELLNRISTETGGQYFRARDKEGLKEIYTQIDKLEKAKVENISFKRVEEKFLVFVLAALALLFSEIILRYTLFRKFP